MTERSRAADTGSRLSPCDSIIESSIGRMVLRLSYVEGPDGEAIELMSNDIA